MARINPLSPTWKAVTDHGADRLRDLRARLESNITHEETLQVRAQIREIKALLALTEGEEALIEAEQNYLPE